TVAGGNTQVTSYTADSKFYALLTPTTADANATFLTLTVKKTADGSTTTLLVKGIPATEAGKSYTYTLAVGKDLAQVGNVTVENWTDGTAIPGGEAEEVIPNYTTYNEVGSGTEADPYQIWNKAQLMNFNEVFGQPNISCDKHIKLMKNIDLTGKTWTPIGGTGNAGIFKGVIDGNFHTIKGLNITENSMDGTGIVRVNDAVGVIQNLIIDGAAISNEASNCRVGVFVGNANKGTVKNCHVINSTITASSAQYIGGLVVYNQDGGKLIGCSVINTEFNYNASGNLGGLAYYSDSGKMTGCMFHGSLNLVNGANKDIFVLAAVEVLNATSLLTSVYCQNTYTGAYITKTLWGRDVSVT
ncbi:MAG: fimbrillin family protein, partial [Acinetobacter sp.]